MKIALISLGCAKNLVDSEGLLGRLAEAEDIEIVGNPDGADGVIINTCGFLQSARQESEAITTEMLQLQNRGQLGWVAMAGCLVERYGPSLEETFPEVTFLGFDDYEQVETVVRRAQAGGRNPPPPPARRGPRKNQGIHGSRFLLTRQSFAYLRISEGCNLRCSFCVIPTIRGAFQSRPLEDVVGEAEALALGGVKELVIVSQDSTFFGRDQGAPQPRLPELLAALDRVDGIEWIRLQYMNPAFTTPEVLDAIAGLPKVVPYMDIPIQHAADGVLKRMRRSPGIQGIRGVLTEARRRIPDLTLRTTVMVGFPGESEAEFRELLDFLEEIRFDRLGCFTFSSEPGSEAAGLSDPLPEEVKQSWYDRVMSLQGSITKEAQDARVGTIQPVMVDLPPPDEDTWGEGRTLGDSPEVDCKVLLEGNNLATGGPVLVRITARHEYDLIGETIHS
jgi:ribosomal protein S12 methylthiotransferase